MSLLTKYAELHTNPAGAGDKRPTALQIIQDQALEGKLNDKTFLVTGFGTGIGYETARALAKTGARVFLTVRDMERGKKILGDLLKQEPTLEQSRLKLILMDLSSLKSVPQAAEAFKAESSELHVLVNNAGIVGTTYSLTEDGFEQQFQVNHLSHFYLFQLLKPLLLKSATPSFHSRVINVSSAGHRNGEVNIGDYNFKTKAYDPMQAYFQSKFCNIWMANEIERLYGDQKLHGLSLHPGGILTDILKGSDPSIQASIGEMFKNQEVLNVAKSVEQGAATTVFAAVGKEFEGRGGIYLEECQEGIPYDPSTGFIGMGYADKAFDEAGEKQLWKDSLAFVGLEASA